MLRYATTNEKAKSSNEILELRSYNSSYNIKSVAFFLLQNHSTLLYIFSGSNWPQQTLLTGWSLQLLNYLYECAYILILYLFEHADICKGTIFVNAAVNLLLKGKIQFINRNAGKRGSTLLLYLGNSRISPWSTKPRWKFLKSFIFIRVHLYILSSFNIIFHFLWHKPTLLKTWIRNFLRFYVFYIKNYSNRVDNFALKLWWNDIIENKRDFGWVVSKLSI